MRLMLLYWLLAAAAMASSTAGTIDSVKKVADQLVQSFNDADYEGIQSLFSKEMDEALPLEKSKAFFSGLREQMGKIKDPGEGRFVPPAVIYEAHFEKGGTLDLQLTLNSERKIAGLFFRPHIPSEPAPEKHQTRLSLPFKGSWLVFWGGDTQSQNQHYEVPNQKFALDLLGADAEGKTKEGTGKRNEHYLAFGRNVLAPADGEVIEVIEGVRDNIPPSMNPYSAVGNCVIIKHADREYSVLAHFKQASILVRPGDTVKRGQVLGQCGNSGNSSEAHIHYHLQHAGFLQDGLGIKPLFDRVKVTRDGKTEVRTNYSPVKGDIISPAD